MTTRGTRANFSAIDDRLLDGLEFCGKVYDLFEQILGLPDGKRRLRLRKTTTEKRLVEELLPLARYVQTRYQAGRRIKVRWFGGSQPYDAIIWSSGSLVHRGVAPRKVFLEITTAVHPNDHLLRKRLDEHGGSFGVKGIRREGKETVSEPHVFSGGENASDLAQQIMRCLDRKAEKKYPPSTVLVINCVPNCMVFEDEWTSAVEHVRMSTSITFREVFLLDLQGSHSATLYRNRPEKQLGVPPLRLG